MEDSSESLKKFLTQVYEETLCGIYSGSLHPGGLNLTRRVGELAEITGESIVLDVASGMGASAISIAKEFGCPVIGIDLSKRFVRESKFRASEILTYGDSLDFLVGDAEFLPFKDSSFNVVLCECSFNLFPDKRKVLHEIYRILKVGGKFVLTDFVLKKDLPKHQRNKFNFAFCIAGAETSEKIVKWMEEVNFTDIYVEDHSDKLLSFGIQLLLSSSDFVSENLENLENLFYEDAFRYVLIAAVKSSK
ncbi:MAG: methyltransferase domain-containing protein [Candidatus Bathyarchaeia archaeon]